jgi:hypothetical protein
MASRYFSSQSTGYILFGVGITTVFSQDYYEGGGKDDLALLLPTKTNHKRAAFVYHSSSNLSVGLRSYA